MESTLSTTVSKPLNPNSNPFFIPRLHRNFSATRSIQSQLGRGIFNSDLHSLNNFTLIASSSSSSSSSLRNFSSMAVPPVRSRSQCVSSSAASFASGGGGSGGGGGAGGGGDGAVDISDSSSDVIILDVRGMMCGGCVASVKRILENQPQISSANVDLTTETAVVWPISEAKVVSNWQKKLGVELAKHLTSCGFESNLRGEGSTAGDIAS